ncbi:hypothetical protein F5Y16DRAFT_401920 [Xylariaceae sp. FL0255]|nr:hypothetical protein F5Y16DRAFT_401920 [Xylariaceae sp. FL0255]
MASTKLQRPVYYREDLENLLGVCADGSSETQKISECKEQIETHDLEQWLAQTSASCAQNDISGVTERMSKTSMSNKRTVQIDNKKEVKCVFLTFNETERPELDVGWRMILCVLMINLYNDIEPRPCGAATPTDTRFEAILEEILKPSSNSKIPAERLFEASEALQHCRFENKHRYVFVIDRLSGRIGSARSQLLSRFLTNIVKGLIIDVLKSSVLFVEESWRGPKEVLSVQKIDLKIKKARDAQSESDEPPMEFVLSGSTRRMRYDLATVATDQSDERKESLIAYMREQRSVEEQEMIVRSYGTNSPC